MRCVLGSTRAQGHDPSGVVRGRVHLPEPGSRTTQFSFLSGMGGGRLSQGAGCAATLEPLASGALLAAAWPRRPL